MAADLDYVPMPDNVVALIEKIWKDKIKDAGGQSLELTECGKRRHCRRLSLFSPFAPRIRRRLVQR